MKKIKSKTIITASLILGISASSTFAGANAIKNDEPIDIFRQSQDNALGVSSTTGILSQNLRNLISNARIRNMSPIRIPVNAPTKSNSAPRPKVNLPKPKATEPKKSIADKLRDKKKKDRNNSGNLLNGKTATSNTSERKNKNGSRSSKRTTRYYRLIYNAANLEDLTPAQRANVMKMHKWMLKKEVAQNMLTTIQICEAGGLLVLVGDGSVKRSKEFESYRKNLTTETHPVYQFPKNLRCFFHNKKLNRHSTAAGYFQITRTNFDRMVKYLGIKDFSKESQQIMALELIRTGQAIKVPGNYKGKGYVELMKAARSDSTISNPHLASAIIYGTDDWASSPHSRWRCKNPPSYLKTSRNIAVNMQKKNSDKLKDQKYFQGWLDEVERDANG